MFHGHLYLAWAKDDEDNKFIGFSKNVVVTINNFKNYAYKRKHEFAKLIVEKGFENIQFQILTEFPHDFTMKKYINDELRKHAKEHNATIIGHIAKPYEEQAQANRDRAKQNYLKNKDKIRQKYLDKKA